ncbi:hypothetical protein NDU88_001679 [Pleurodeles waltl]|uniref:Uncharacterized protein n=1 Tax=Pleurodeles waltl TaxID=8319 RepID=A0AAV7T009_PLEWA|nr:hypothetical protein NDU88_001679 [Pleurodeles waltl]
MLPTGPSAAAAQVTLPALQHRALPRAQQPVSGRPEQALTLNHRSLQAPAVLTGAQASPRDPLRGPLPTSRSKWPPLRLDSFEPGGVTELNGFVRDCAGACQGKSFSPDTHRLSWCLGQIRAAVPGAPPPGITWPLVRLSSGRRVVRRRPKLSRQQQQTSLGKTCTGPPAVRTRERTAAGGSRLQRQVGPGSAVFRCGSGVGPLRRQVVVSHDLLARGPK